MIQPAAKDAQPDHRRVGHIVSVASPSATIVLLAMNRAAPARGRGA